LINEYHKSVDANNTLKKKYKWYDLHFFGININPWVAVVLGAFGFILRGGILEPILVLLFILGIVKLIADWRNKRNSK